jgi:hypothetical protein
MRLRQIVETAVLLMLSGAATVMLFLGVDSPRSKYPWMEMACGLISAMVAWLAWSARQSRGRDA